MVAGHVATNPGPVRAGEDASLDVVLDKAPNFEGGEIEVTVVGPQNSNATLTARVKTHPGTTDYHVSIAVPPSAPGGIWSVSKVIFFTGAQVIPLTSINQSFQVVANPNIVFPTRAQVMLSLSQAQLLRSEAANLQFRLQVLKANLTLSAGNATAASSIAESLGKKINEELGFLAATETRFHALSSSQVQLDALASVFFGDLRVSYEDAKSQLKDRSARAERGGSLKSASLASKQGSGEPQRYPVLAQVVFRVFEQNELAYLTVANAGTLTFDLDISSSPEGATISYRRRGDSYRQHPDQTNSVIRALPYAIWTIRFQKQGYRDEEREHDPFREPNHVVNVQLRQ